MKTNNEADIIKLTNKYIRNVKYFTFGHLFIAVIVVSMFGNVTGGQTKEIMIVLLINLGIYIYVLKQIGKSISKLKCTECDEHLRISLLKLSNKGFQCSSCDYKYMLKSIQ